MAGLARRLVGLLCVGPHAQPSASTIRNLMELHLQMSTSAGAAPSLGRLSCVGEHVHASPRHAGWVRHPARSHLQPPCSADQRRWMATRRRFYRSVGVVGADGQFEVSLDQRKLKTPGGRLLQLPSRQLALAVAHEWEACGDEIHLSLMHLTGLCFTVLDNPHVRTPAALVEKIADYLDTDTILFPVEHPSELAELQQREWGVVLMWFQQRFNAVLQPAPAGSLVCDVPSETVETLKRHLETYDIWALTGLLFAVEAVRSTLLPLAAMERKLTPQEVVRLSRLEADYQTKFWGRVEWAHDVDAADTEARVAAGLLLAQLVTATAHNTRQKQTAV